MKFLIFSVFITLFIPLKSNAVEKFSNYIPMTESGFPVNAHGGQIFNYQGYYYWVGENEGKGADDRHGFNIYRSTDFKYWSLCGNVLNVYSENNLYPDVTKGDIFERPRIIYNKKTKKFNLWFHYEKKNSSYTTAKVAVATSGEICKNYQIVRMMRLNPRVFPLGEGKGTLAFNKYFLRDFNKGQMSRDLTVFDDGSKSYLISSSENNATLIVTELNDKFDNITERFVRVNPGTWSEAPIVMKANGYFYIIASGTTGWKPNKAQLYRSNKMLGKWHSLGNPVVGIRDRNNTFYSQGTSIFKVEDNYIFLGDRWNESDLSKSEYVWKRIRISKNTIEIGG